MFVYAQDLAYPNKIYNGINIIYMCKCFKRKEQSILGYLKIKFQYLVDIKIRLNSILRFDCS